MHVVVIGAGIVGVSTAIWLRRFGADVTLVDRDAPGQGASFGNAGVLAACAVVPSVVPSTIPSVPRMLLDRDAPLFLRWSYLPRLAPWLLRLLPNARDSRVRDIVQALAPLVSDSPDQHRALTEGLSARRFLAGGEYVYAYANRAEFDAGYYDWDIKKAHGFVPDLIEGGEVAEFDPAYGPDFGCLAVLKGHGHVLNPGGYVAALAEDFVAMGGHVRRAEVTDFTLTDGQITQIATTDGVIDCDRAVIASGAFSARLLKKLDLKVPLESERGYHITFKNASGQPKRPTMINAGQFVATPMTDGLRCAGILEFGGLDAGPSRAPFGLLRRQTAKALPHLQASEEVEWMGHRPALPDSLPMLGEVGQTGIYTAFGHHHVGLTGGPKSGRILAGLIMGQSPNLDLTPYRTDRFH